METIDPVLTSWAKEWWPKADVYWKESSNTNEPGRWFIRNGPGAAALQLGDGGRLDARVALHLVVNAELHRGTVGPDAK